MRCITPGTFVLPLLLIAACETGEPRADDPLGIPRAAAEVEMTDDATFTPQTVTVQTGDTVLWRNTSGEEHTVTADQQQAQYPESVQLPEGAEPFDSGSVAEGETFTYTFDTPGTYRYFCIPHEEMGMVGEVHVEEREVVRPQPRY